MTSRNSGSGSSSPSLPPLLVVSRFVFTVEDEWEIPVIAPVNGRKTTVGQVSGRHSSPRDGLHSRNLSLPALCAGRSAPTGSDGGQSGTSRGWLQVSVLAPLVAFHRHLCLIQHLEVTVTDSGTRCGRDLWPGVHFLGFRED